jgi:hypothetical protein
MTEHTMSIPYENPPRRDREDDSTMDPEREDGGDFESAPGRSRETDTPDRRDDDAWPDGTNRETERDRSDTI